MDSDLAALKVAIEAAAPGTPSLTCLKIADAVEVVLREAKAEAWDEGHRTWQQRGPDDCQCYAYSESECGCGLYGTGELLSLKSNPYRD